MFSINTRSAETQLLSKITIYNQQYSVFKNTQVEMELRNDHLHSTIQLFSGRNGTKNHNLYSIRNLLDKTA